jgi:vancomycin permeability regulator SanA
MLIVISLAVTVLSCNWAVQLKTNKLVYSNIEKILHRKVGLLLGTSKLLASGAQNLFTIISQEFHNRRAIYIEKHLGLKAIGYNAKDVNVYYGFKTQWREKSARTNMFLDFIFDAEPRFLGDNIEIK